MENVNTKSMQSKAFMQFLYNLMSSSKRINVLYIVYIEDVLWANIRINEFILCQHVQQTVPRCSLYLCSWNNLLDLQSLQQRPEICTVLNQRLSTGIHSVHKGMSQMSYN